MSAQELITDHLDLWTGAVTHKSGSGRGASGKNGKIELTGIKKLRELILELAVRGKLVEQDPSDEPASVLLDRIAEEKARLVKEGKIKKPKKLPAIAEEDKPFELPKGWQWARLSDALRVINGRAYKKHEMLQEGTPLLRVGNLFTSNEWYYSDLQLEDDKYIDNGDLIYAWSASFGPFIWEGGRAIYHYHIWKLELFDHSSTNKHFLYSYLKAVTEEIKSSGSGIAMIHMTKSKMEELVVPLPPLDEQQRIVAKVDELMVLCDRLEQQVGDQREAHEVLIDTLLDALARSEDSAELTENWSRVAEHFDTLFTTEASIDKLKQTIIQIAVLGRLVEQNSNDESAIHFLNRYGIEGKPYFLSGWAKAALGELGEILGGSTPTKSNTELWGGSVPWVSPKDMKLSVIHDSQSKVTEQALQQTTLKKVPKHSLLMVVRGMILAHSFPVAINELEVTINQDIKALVPPKEISPYLLLYLQAEKSKLVGLVDRSSHGTCKLVSEKLWSHVVYLPPIEEQARIIATVDELMTLCDQLKARLSESSKTRSQLAETIVEQAVS